MTITLDRMTKDLVKSARKGHAQAGQKKQDEKLRLLLAHSFHFNTCLSCGISAFGTLADDGECQERRKLYEEGFLILS